MNGKSCPSISGGSCGGSEPIIAVGGSYRDWFAPDGPPVSGDAFPLSLFGMNVGYVFSRETLGNNPQYIGQDLCHEFGHMGGLSHQMADGVIMSNPFSNQNAGWAVGINEARQKQDDLAILLSVFGAATTPVPSLPVPTASATFLSADTSNQGAWQKQYGADGFSLAQGNQSLPGYSKLTVGGAADYVWARNSLDKRSLDGLAACWYSPSQFALDLDLTDGASHQVALYFVDWDTSDRQQRVEILDAGGNVLDSRDVAAFHGGLYLSWTITGHVTIRISNAPGHVNAVLSGVFFSPASAPPVIFTLKGVKYQITEVK
jgi:hypothetical protein